jgi:hypothetical protein
MGEAGRRREGMEGGGHEEEGKEGRGRFGGRERGKGGEGRCRSHHAPCHLVCAQRPLQRVILLHAVVPLKAHLGRQPQPDALPNLTAHIPAGEGGGGGRGKGESVSTTQAGVEDVGVICYCLLLQCVEM